LHIDRSDDAPRGCRRWLNRMASASPASSVTRSTERSAPGSMIWANTFSRTWPRRCAFIVCGVGHRHRVRLLEASGGIPRMRAGTIRAPGQMARTSSQATTPPLEGDGRSSCPYTNEASRSPDVGVHCQSASIKLYAESHGTSAIGTSRTCMLKHPAAASSSKMD
jgi:hypothetical protein